MIVGDVDLFSPILPHGDGDDDPADFPADAEDPGVDDGAPPDDDSPRLDSRDSMASGFDASKRRRRLLEQAYRQTRRVSALIDEIHDTMEEAEHMAERGERQAATDEELLMRRVDLGAAIMMKASVVMLVTTAGIATYLATLWNTLPVAIRCGVAVTFAWLAGATFMIPRRQCSSSVGGEEEGEEGPPTARGQSLVVAAPATRHARTRFGIAGVAGTPRPSQILIHAPPSSQ